MPFGEDYVEEDIVYARDPKNLDYETAQSLPIYPNSKKETLLTITPTVKGNSSAARVDALKIQQAISDKKIEEVTRSSGAFQALGFHID